MSTRILAAAGPGEIRIAVAGEDGLQDYALWRPGAPDGVGELRRGRIEAVAPVLGGAFVDIGSGTGFLPLSGAASPPTEGTTLVLRVARAAQNGKGPRLAAADDGHGYAARGPVELLRPAPTPLVRLAAEHPDAAIEVDDPELRAEAPPELRPRIAVVVRAFPAEIAGEIAALAEPDVFLPGGLRASIHPTPALVAIDLDTAGGAQPGENRLAAHFGANRRAMLPLLRQLRLRNLSGAILLDLAGLPGRKRQALRPDIEAALASDPLRPRLLGFTALGLAEIVRPRIHPPLHELLSGPHAAALAALREAAAAAAGGTPGRGGARLPVIRAPAPVLAAIAADAVAQRWFRDRHGALPRLEPDPNRDACTWELRDDP